jgi:hypothetical protein
VSQTAGMGITDGFVSLGIYLDLIRRISTSNPSASSNPDANCWAVN